MIDENPELVQQVVDRLRVLLQSHQHSDSIADPIPSNQESNKRHPKGAIELMKADSSKGLQQTRLHEVRTLGRTNRPT